MLEPSIKHYNFHKERKTILGLAENILHSKIICTVNTWKIYQPRFPFNPLWTPELTQFSDRIFSYFQQALNHKDWTWGPAMWTCECQFKFWLKCYTLDPALWRYTWESSERWPKSLSSCTHMADKLWKISYINRNNIGLQIEKTLIIWVNSDVNE